MKHPKGYHHSLVPLHNYNIDMQFPLEQKEHNQRNIQAVCPLEYHPKTIPLYFSEAYNS